MADEISLSCEQSRQIDSVASQKYGIPGLILMENAGLRCADVVAEVLSEFPEPRSATIIAGKGNNGGDGYVIARHLFNKGVAVRVFGIAVKSFLSGSAPVKSAVADYGRMKKQRVAEKFGLDAPSPPEDDSMTNLRIISRMGIPLFEIGTDIPSAGLTKCLEETDVVVDALMGTGAIGRPRPPYDDIIRAINASGRKVISVDLPSGLNANDGSVAGECVRADITVTFVAAKIGFSLNEGPRHCGKVVVADISVPRALLDAFSAKGEQ